MKEECKKIIENFYTKIKTNPTILNKVIREDKEEFITDKLKLEQIIKKYLNYETCIRALNNNQTIKSIGNIALIYDGNPYITIEMAIKSILTNNNMTFFTGNLEHVNRFLIRTINESLTECKSKTKLYINKDIYDLYAKQNTYDLGVFIGDKLEYKKVSSKFSRPIIYNGFGTVEIYADDIFFRNELTKIDKFVYYNNFNVNYYNNKNLDEAIKEINKIVINDTAAIFTKNKEKALEFVNKVNARNIYVNKNPFEKYEFKFDEDQLVIRKEIIT